MFVKFFVAASGSVEDMVQTNVPVPLDVGIEPSNCTCSWIALLQWKQGPNVFLLMSNALIGARKSLVRLVVLLGDVCREFDTSLLASSLYCVNEHSMPAWPEDRGGWFNLEI